jgi:tetratricopeptide (TPR) repeat protein
MRYVLKLFSFFFFCFLSLSNIFSQVKIQESTITIPTYPIGAPETTPLFYTPEVYQGAQLRIYPYPYLGKLSNQKIDRIYKAVILENEYIKICVLPELGGRLYYAQDKTNGYDFIYRNTVIKPALIGMTGAWISGGVEWNVPHHHRASTFMPVEYKLDENADGSKTIWVGEYEKRSQTRWLVGLTLYPGKSYVEASLRYLNVTPVANSFLFWANAAVHANEDYQVVFPPDVEKAVFHSKTQFTDYPVSRQVYQGIDFTKGVDISLWKNTTSPTSFFAWDTEKDFMAGIDHGKKAGTAIVGNHYIFPGKKFWNWGNNDVQRLWDQMLTDTDGPYLEMMTGFYSDNQPDYSWNAPFGVKSGTMYYYPVKNLTSVKEANKDAAVNLEIKGGKATIQAYTTSKMSGGRIVLFYQGKEMFAKEINPDPVLPFSTEVKVKTDAIPQDFTLILVSPQNEELVRYTPPVKKNAPEPPKYQTPEDPSKITQADLLYQKGLRLEQFGSASYNPEVYYQEALKRDSAHILVNTQLGIRYLKPGLYDVSQKHLERATKALTANYTAARYSEPLYYLGVNLFYQNRVKEAYDIFYKASWNQEWASQAYYMLAVIDCLNGEYNASIDKLSESLTYNGNNIEAMNLMGIILRRNGAVDLAKQTIDESRRIDPLNLTLAFEQYQMNKTGPGSSALKALRHLFRDEADNFLETASRYLMAGFYSDAAELLMLATSPEFPVTSKNPLIYYYIGYCYKQGNEMADAAKWFSLASAMNTDYSFPYGPATFAVLTEALKLDSKDVTAHYLMGNILCDHAPGLAYASWQKADQANPMVNRNLAFVLANIFDKPKDALEKLEQVLENGAGNPMFLLERDVYAAYAGLEPSLRLAFMEKYKNISSSWDKTELRRAELLNLTGNYDAAIEILKTQHFYIAEITTLNPHVVWSNAFLSRGITFLKNNETERAIADFSEVFKFPRNLEIVRDSRTILANYWLGKASQKKGDQKKANENFKIIANNNDAASGWGASGTALVPYYQALAWFELGNRLKAEEIYQRMITQGNNMLNTKYHEAAVDQSVNIRQARKYHMAEGYFYIGLGNKGLGNVAEAEANFKRALETDPSFFDIKLVEL